MKSVLRRVLTLVVPAVLWVLAVSSRGDLLHAHCGVGGKVCNEAGIPAFDRIAIYLNVPGADPISFWGQNLAGVLSLLVLFSIPGPRIARSLVWLEAVLWNGFLMEAIRLLVQRPRPFVYADLVANAANTAHYTSFYSGHTSFASVSSAIAFFLIADAPVSKPLKRLIAVILAAVVVVTGVCRVLSGRHFPSDVLAAVVAGVIIARFLGGLRRNRVLTDTSLD